MKSRGPKIVVLEPSVTPTAVAALRRRLRLVISLHRLTVTETTGVVIGDVVKLFMNGLIVDIIVCVAIITEYASK